MKKPPKKSSPFGLPHQSLEAVLEFVRRYAAQDVETGLFLLTRADEIDLSVVALTGTIGVGRSPFQFRISGKALNQLFEWASESCLQIRAQIHSHKGRAFLSPTDLEYGLSVEGFMSAIVPNYARPPMRPDPWGWWQFEQGEWRTVVAPRVRDCAATVVYFDERGVYE